MTAYADPGKQVAEEENDLQTQKARPVKNISEAVSRFLEEITLGLPAFLRLLRAGECGRPSG